MGDGKAAPAGATEKVQLDELMLAMDVVDTLRHREQLIARELNAGAREKDLVERLRKIYADQGIDVPEHILVDGVQALDQQRFVYEAPASSLSVRLARVYVTRSRWLPKLRTVALVLAGLWAVQYFAWQRPRAARARHAEVQLASVLPTELDELRADLLELAADSGVAATIERLYEDGKSATERSDLRAAEEAVSALKSARGTLLSEYAVRIVARPGEVSGVWRIPDANSNARNFYLIVEAVDTDGQIVKLRITSEEDQSTRLVSKWGLRVSESIFNAVRDDKLDDGILQNRRVGKKPRGYLQHTYDIETDGGTILDW